MDVLRYATPGVAPVEADADLRALADTAPILIWRCNTEKNCDWFNRPWLEFTGRSLQQELGFGWADGVHPEDQDRCLATFTRAVDARRAFMMDYRLRRHDGAYRWVRGNGAPVHDEDGDFAGFCGCAVDITDHMELQEQLRETIRRQEILVDELNHRTKNIATSIQSIAAQTLRRAKVDPAIVDKLERRLISLAHSHGLLAHRNLEGVSLKTLLGRIVMPYDGDGDSASRITLRGEDVTLPTNWVVMLGLAVHELATNAGKYGALSTEGGRVLLSWDTMRTDRGDVISFEWREVGGPPVVEPAHKGFGTCLMERGVGMELGGRVNLRFLPEGVVWKAEIPLGEGTFHVR